MDSWDALKHPPAPFKPIRESGLDRASAFQWLSLKRAPSLRRHSRRHGRFHRLAAALLLAPLLLQAPAQAAFETPFLTAQSASLGGASLAAEGDPAAVFVNPAGIGGMKAPQAYFTYGDMFAGLSGVDGLSTGFIAAGAPTRLGSLSLGFGIFNASGLLQERTIALGWATELWQGVRVGLTGKQLYHSYSPAGDPLAASDPVFKNGASRGALAFDAGLAVPIGGLLQVGVAVRNINQPNVGLASEDRVAREVQGGMSLLVLGFKLTGDLSILNNGSLGAKQAVPALGLEKELYGGRMAFRAGASTTAWSGGMGLRVGRVGFEYALVLNRNLLQNNMGSHTVGLRLQFGGSK